VVELLVWKQVPDQLLEEVGLLVGALADPKPAIAPGTPPPTALASAAARPGRAPPPRSPRRKCAAPRRSRRGQGPACGPLARPVRFLFRPACPGAAFYYVRTWRCPESERRAAMPCRWPRRRWHVADARRRTATPLASDFLAARSAARSAAAERPRSPQPYRPFTTQPPECDPGLPQGPRRSDRALLAVHVVGERQPTPDSTGTRADRVELGARPDRDVRIGLLSARPSGQADTHSPQDTHDEAQEGDEIRNAMCVTKPLPMRPITSWPWMS